MGGAQTCPMGKTCPALWLKVIISGSHDLGPSFLSLSLSLSLSLTHTHTHTHTQEGYLYITGRKKEIIITAGGEKIAPVPIENAIKHDLPIVSNAMVIGENKKYLSCLLTLKVR